jgi:hypothetical protein
MALTASTQTLSTADAILKDLYVGPVVEMMNQKTYVLDQVERDADHIDHTGRRAIVPVHTNRNRGRGARGDNSTLPLAGSQSYQDAIISIKYHYYGMELSDPAIEASTSNEGAFINLLESETKGVARDMRKDINRQVYGDGTGLVAGVRANSTTTTVEIDQGIQYIGIGDPVDVLLKSNGTVNGVGVAATSVTARAPGAAPNITIADALAGTATTSYGVYISGAYGKEMDGLRNITNDDRTLHSINSASAGNEFWDGQEVAASSAVAGEDLFIQLADKVGATGNGEVEVFLTTRGVRRRLANTYQSQKRFNDAQAVNIHGGYSAIMVNEIPVIADDDAPKGYVFGLDKSALKWFEQTNPGWLTQRDGGVFHLKDGSTAGQKMNVWQAWFRWYAALGCVAPNRTGRIPDAADDNAT